MGASAYAGPGGSYLVKADQLDEQANSLEHVPGQENQVRSLRAAAARSRTEGKRMNTEAGSAAAAAAKITGASTSSSGSAQSAADRATSSGSSSSGGSFTMPAAPPSTSGFSFANLLKPVSLSAPRMTLKRTGGGMSTATKVLIGVAVVGVVAYVGHRLLRRKRG